MLREHVTRLVCGQMRTRCGDRDAFEVVVLGEECARPKPHPDPYQVALNALGLLPHEAIVIEDSPSGALSQSLHDQYVKVQSCRCLSVVLGMELLCFVIHPERCSPCRMEQCQCLPRMLGQCTRTQFYAAEGPRCRVAEFLHMLPRQSNPTCCPSKWQVRMSVQ